MRHRSTAAMARRWALRRAHGRCEDLAELLGRASDDADPGAAAAARRAALAVARDLWRLVAGHRSAPATGTALSPSALETLVEAADEAIRDAALGVRDADRLAVDLAARLLAGISGDRNAGVQVVAGGGSPGHRVPRRKARTLCT
jgi:hypothetical protein